MIVEDIVASVPGWNGSGDFEIELLGGLTNTNYLVGVNHEKFVLRVSGANTEYLGINRDHEVEALRNAFRHGIGPEIYHYFQPEGHLVTRYINGRHWSYEEYCQKMNLSRMVDAVKTMHRFPPIKAESNPFQRIESYLKHTDKFNVPYPEGFHNVLAKMRSIETDLSLEADKYRGFCHNDLFSLNFLDDGSLHFIDWEFAGMGDIFYDLATLAYTFDSVGEIPDELQEFILARYFGDDDIDGSIKRRFNHMKFMVLLYAVMWGLLQYGLQNEGISRPIDGFDCMEYSKFMFNIILESDGFKF